MPAHKQPTVHHCQQCSTPADIGLMKILTHTNKEPSSVCAGGGQMALPGRPAAAFSGLPSGRILTLNMDVPEAWLVEPVRADLDLDNLRLADLGSAPSLQVRAHAGMCLSLTRFGGLVDMSRCSKPHISGSVCMQTIRPQVRACHAVSCRKLRVSLPAIWPSKGTELRP